MARKESLSHSSAKRVEMHLIPENTSSKPQPPSMAKHVRKITSERREQNRKAQKQYRERQKKRLRDLERTLEISIADCAKGSSDQDQGRIQPNCDDSNTVPDTVGVSLDEQQDHVSPLVLESSIGPLFDEPFNPNIFGEILGFENSLKTTGSSSIDESTPDSSVAGLDTSATTVYPSTRCLSLRSSDPLTALTSDTICHVILGNKEESNALSSIFSMGNVNMRDILLTGLAAYGYCEDPFSRNSIPPILEEAQPTRTLFPYPQFGPSLLRQNVITLSRINIMSACLQNAWSMGLSTESAVSHQNSPFHEAFLSSDVASTELQFSHLKPDLRPTICQIQNRHPIYIDTLPFPKLRDRIIALRRAGKEVFDEDQLCKDIHDGGIVCWGSHGSAGSGSPWDGRSWEFQEEFLKKWWMLTGGQDVDLAKQSRWWAEMRGENV